MKTYSLMFTIHVYLCTIYAYHTCIHNLCVYIIYNQYVYTQVVSQYTCIFTIYCHHIYMSYILYIHDIYVLHVMMPENLGTSETRYLNYTIACLFHNKYNL